MKQVRIARRAFNLLWAVAGVGLVVLVLLQSPTLASAAVVNAGMLAMRDGLMESEELEPGGYPRYDVLPTEAAAGTTMKDLRQAVALDGDSLTARWALGRAALAAGDSDAAAGALRPLIGQAKGRPLVYADVLTALSRRGEHEDVLALYQAAPPPQSTQAVSDTVALALLDRATRGQGKAETRRGREWEKVLELRPGDLYTNYHLWKQAQEAADVEAAIAYSETLTYFPLEAIDPTDDRLLDYAVQVMPALLEEGVWAPEKMLNVASYLVWQHNTVASVEQLLENLTARYPAQPDWPFYLAELYHRRGRVERAETAYQQVLQVDPDYAQAYLRLGMVSEESSGRLSEATKWYVQYNALAPDDLLGLKCLTETCTALGEAGVGDENCIAAAKHLLRNTRYLIHESSDPNLEPAAVLQAALATRTDDRRIVAGLLDVPAEAVELGPDLVEDGGFEMWIGDSPEGWEWSSMFNREPFAGAAFLGSREGLTPFEAKRSARIDGLWVEQVEDKSPARAGFWYRGEIDVSESIPYLISLSYSTGRKARDRTSALWLSGEGVFWRSDLRLTRTDGSWIHFAAVSWNGSHTGTAVRPFFRLFAPGSLMVDNLQIRPVQLSDTITVEKHTYLWRD